MELQVLLLASILSLVFKVSCVVVSDSDNIEYSEGPTMAKRVLKVPDVIISTSLICKYLYIRVFETHVHIHNQTSKVIIRGFKKSESARRHYKKVKRELSSMGLTSLCEGGGKIRIDVDNKDISVYGYTRSFGMGNHKVAIDKLRKKFKGYKYHWIDASEY